MSLGDGVDVCEEVGEATGVVLEVSLRVRKKWPLEDFLGEPSFVGLFGSVGDVSALAFVLRSENGLVPGLRCGSAGRAWGWRD